MILTYSSAFTKALNEIKSPIEVPKALAGHMANPFIVPAGTVETLYVLEFVVILMLPPTLIILLNDMVDEVGIMRISDGNPIVTGYTPP